MAMGNLSNTKRMKKAIIIGGSGLTGGILLNNLLADVRYQKVISIGRKAVGLSHPKLEQHTGDLFALENFAPLFTDVDDVYICIGTTQAKTPDETTYFKIDYGIPVAAAALAAKAQVPNVCIVSAMGANAKSRIFYNATKGKMEDDIRKMGIQNLNIARPSLIVGNRHEGRTGEGVAKILMTTLDFLIPKKYKAIQAETIARAMVALANASQKQEIFENDVLLDLGKV